MAWYTAVLLGLVQGLAEFLPISSSGHLLLLQHLFGITDGGLVLTVVLHLATLGAVVVVYWRRLWALIRHPWCAEMGYLVLGTVVTCGLVLVGKDWLESLFRVQALPWLFIVTGVLLLLPGIIQPRTTQRAHWWQFLLMGAAQGVAVLPGLSRSGLTIATGRLSGLPQADATDQSFLLSIPVIVASLVYTVWQGGTVVSLGWGNLVLAFLTAFMSGYAALKLMLAGVRKFRWGGFALYLFLLGGGLLLFLGLGGGF